MEENGKHAARENGKDAATSSPGAAGGRNTVNHRREGPQDVNGDRKRNRENGENGLIPSTQKDQEIEEKKKRRTNGGSSNIATNGTRKSESAKKDATEPGKRTRAIRPDEERSLEGSHTDEEADVPVKEIHMTRKEKEEEERMRKLDPSTLALLREALSNATPQNHLNDDEMMHFMARVDREARAQADLQGVSAPEESDGTMIEELVAEAEDLSLGREVLNRAIAAANKNASAANPMDRRTLDWVRKAAGLQRTKMESLLRDNLEVVRQAKGAKGVRTTRRMARDTREERREKGLGILLSVIDELEGQLGPYPAAKQKQRRSLVPAIPKRGTMTEPDNKPPKGINRKKSFDNKRKQGPKPDSDKVSKETLHHNGRKSPERKPKRVLWDDVWPAQDENADPYNFPDYHSDRLVFAQRSHRLLKCMSRAVLTWARYEFFYSDVDRAWYTRNEFEQRAARLGIRPGTLLRQREWNAIRRKIRCRPRRFSRHFIEQEYESLQKYRVRVRMLQEKPDPSFATRLGFDFEVPKPIPVGAPISAVARKTAGELSSPIQRGTVLSYSRGFYVVHLTGGIALLPDFMVCRHGPPDVLIPAPRSSLIGMRDALVEESGPTESTASWSGPGPLDEVAGSWNKTNDAQSSKDTSAIRNRRNMAAENELVFAAMICSEMALRRKKIILDAIASLDSNGLFDNPSNQSDETRTILQKHLNWLLDSLDETNENYKLSKDYIDCLTEFPAQVISLAPGSRWTVKKDAGETAGYARDRLTESLAARLLLHTWDISDSAVKELGYSESEVAKSKELEDLLRCVGQILLIPSVCSGDDDSVTEAAVARGVQTALAACVNPVTRIEESTIGDLGSYETHLYKNTLDARGEAAHALQDAADLLSFELAALSRGLSE